MSYKFGIDFGTTNSSIAFCYLGDNDEECMNVVDMKDTVPRVVLPSLVYTDGRQVWVGEEAEKKYLDSGMNSGAGLYIQKIKMALEKQGRNLAYEVNGFKISGEDLIAKIFECLRKQAEKEVKDLETDVHGVVLGVPVEYDQTAKDVLVNALYKAGFYSSQSEAVRLTEFVSEPIAVAINYGLDLKRDLTIMVFDFGGGTLDLAVVNLKKNIENDVLHPHETLSKERITLGGEDLTKLFFVNSFCSSEKYGKERVCRNFGIDERLSLDEVWEKLLKNPEGVRFIKRIDECKRDLSDRKAVKFSYIGKNISFEETTFYREDFEESIEQKLEDIGDLVDKCLGSANIEAWDVDKVIIAGGSSLIPVVQQLLVDKFKLHFDKRTDSEVLSSIVRGLALVGFREKQLVEDVVDCDYGVWDDMYNKFLPIIRKGVKIQETKFDKLSFAGLSRTVECTDKSKESVNVQVFQNNLNGPKKLGTVCIPNPGGKKYKIYMTIDPKSAKLMVIFYDMVKCGWIENIPLNERQFDIE